MVTSIFWRILMYTNIRVGQASARGHRQSFQGVQGLPILLPVNIVVIQSTSGSMRVTGTLNCRKTSVKQFFNVTDIRN